MKSFKRQTNLMSLLLVVGMLLPIIGCGEQKAATEVKDSQKTVQKVSIEYCSS